MDEDYDSDLESSIADVLQCTPDSKGDHILAARFLNRFVPAEVPWIHIDLAASNRNGGLGHVPDRYHRLWRAIHGRVAGQRRTTGARPSPFDRRQGHFG